MAEILHNRAFSAGFTEGSAGFVSIVEYATGLGQQSGKQTVVDIINSKMGEGFITLDEDGSLSYPAVWTTPSLSLVVEGASAADADAAFDDYTPVSVKSDNVDGHGQNNDDGYYIAGHPDTPSINAVFTDVEVGDTTYTCLLYTSPSPRDRTRSRMPSSA